MRSATLPEKQKNLLKMNYKKFHGIFYIFWEISVGIGIIITLIVGTCCIMSEEYDEYGVIEYSSIVILLCVIAFIIILGSSYPSKTSLWNTAIKGYGTLRNGISRVWVIGIDRDVTFFSTDKNHTIWKNDNNYSLNMEDYVKFMAGDTILYKTYKGKIERRQKYADKEILPIKDARIMAGSLYVGQSVYIIYKRKAVRNIYKFIDPRLDKGSAINSLCVRFSSDYIIIPDSPEIEGFLLCKSTQDADTEDNTKDNSLSK